MNTQNPMQIAQAETGTTATTPMEPNTNPNEPANTETTESSTSTQPQDNNTVVIQTPGEPQKEVKETTTIKETTSSINIDTPAVATTNESTYVLYGLGLVILLVMVIGFLSMKRRPETTA